MRAASIGGVLIACCLLSLSGPPQASARESGHVDAHDARLDTWLAAAHLLFSPADAPASTPSLSFPCTESLRAGVVCRLGGRGFRPYEMLHITYRVGVGVGDPRRPQWVWHVYRRTATTDGRGAFARPPLRFPVDPRDEMFDVRVTVAGLRGALLTAGAAGGP